LLTRQANLTDFEASDYSIVHTMCQVIYQIGDIEKFFTNVYVEDVRPGQIYFDVMKKSITPLLQSVVEDAIVNAMTRYSIDQALQSKDTIRRTVRQLVQDKLDEIGSGIQVTSIQLVRALWPKQVNDAFEAFITASQDSGKAISEAQAYAENTLNDAAGRVAEELYRSVFSDSMDQQQMDALWAQVAGKAQSTIAEARAYRHKVVTSAEANAKYLQSIQPEFDKRPDLVAQQIYLDAIDQVLRNADEKIILQPSGQAKDHEIRVLVNRDDTLVPKESQQSQGMNQAAAPR
jgi:membrane protease subunit HflK